jgi:diguanylate cyclase (GGDEF)-like protein/PAS domain S-box-containing protein
LTEDLEGIGGSIITSGPLSQQSGMSIEDREAALTAALSAHPDAVLSGYTAGGFLTGLPDGERWRGHRVLELPGPRSTLLELVIPEDRLAIVAAWERIKTVGIAVASAHALEDPGQLLTLTMIDLHERYGTGIVVVTSEQGPSGLGTDVIAGRLMVSARARQATMRKSMLAVITAADANVTRMLGWAPEDLIGLRSSELVHPDDQERAVTTWVELVSTKLSQRIRLRHACKDGSWLWVEIENIHNGADNPDEVEITAQLTDISDEMAAHEAVERRERLLRRLAEALPAGVLQIRRDRSVVFANARLGAILATAEPTLEDLLSETTPDSRAELEAAVDTALTDGKDSELEIEVSTPDVRASRRLAVSVVAVEADAYDGEGALICVTDVTASVQLREQLSFQATRDPLTGCLNRSALMERLSNLLAEEHLGITAIFIDIDNFKPVNDRYGHAAGDEVLISLARRLKGLVRDGDLVARLGGDEFLVVGHGVDGAQSGAMAARLHKAINTPVTAAGETIGLRASTGVSPALPGDTPERLVARADAAMYECKRRGSDAGPVIYAEGQQ